MNCIREAQKSLVYYFKRVWEEAGLRWDSDNQGEIEALVEDIISATLKEAEPLIDQKIEQAIKEAVRQTLASLPSHFVE